jgi:polyisoprenoid-binding protein YceI
MNSQLPAGDWILDHEGSSIGFQAKVFLGLKVTGQFDRYDSAITFGATAAESSISLTVWTDSVQTGNKTRDEHLRADNVFASARIPTLEFHSTTIIETPIGPDITGTLRIRDVGRTVELHATKTTGSDAPRYTAEMVVSPKDYGITRLGTTKPLMALIDATLQRA